MLYKINKQLLLEVMILQEDDENLEDVDHSHDIDPDFEDNFDPDWDLKSVVEKYEQNQNDPLLVNQRQDDSIFDNQLELDRQSNIINNLQSRANIGLGLGLTGAALGSAALMRSLNTNRNIRRS